jgi:protein-L-isoaspartate(D-aspartate) O-methyltransferase
MGAGTGYGTAVLASLAEHVTAVEPITELAEAAAENVSALGVTNAEVLRGDDEALGDARFDVVMLAAAIDAEPANLLARLKPGGRLVALMRRGPVGVAVRYISDDGVVRRESHFNATLPPLERKVSVESFVF